MGQVEALFEPEDAPMIAETAQKHPDKQLLTSHMEEKTSPSFKRFSEIQTYLFTTCQKKLRRL